MNKSIILRFINDWRFVATQPIVESSYQLFNVEFIGLYIDAYKTKITLMGFGVSVWYQQICEE